MTLATRLLTALPTHRFASKEGRLSPQLRRLQDALPVRYPATWDELARRAWTAHGLRTPKEACVRVSVMKLRELGVVIETARGGGYRLVRGTEG